MRPDLDQHTTPATTTASTADHLVTIVGHYLDPERMAAAIAERRSFYHLDVAGDHHLLPDACTAACSCGAESALVADWQTARWWCREHRTSLGMDWQPAIGQRHRLI